MCATCEPWPVAASQVNSEHCRHKIFNADFIVDSQKKDLSLFKMIRNTFAVSPAGILSAYSDNASVIEGSQAVRLMVDPTTCAYVEVCSATEAMMCKEVMRMLRAMAKMARTRGEGANQQPTLSAI